MIQAQSALRSLVDSEPALQPILASHLEDNYGEILSTILIAEIIDWVVDHYAVSPEVGAHVLGWMNNTYGAASEELKDVIATGGVEAIPNPGQPGSELRDLLSPALHAVDPWDDRWKTLGTQSSNGVGDDGAH